MFFSSLFLAIKILLFVILFVTSKWIFKKVWLDNLLLLVGSGLILTEMLSYKSLLVLLVVALLIYAVGCLLYRNRKPWVMALALGLLVSLFAIRQYPLLQSWLGDWWTELMRKPFLSVERLGLSYILFRMIHWIVESYRRTIRSRNILTYINYLFFFPTFMAGPIDTFNNFHYWLTHTHVRFNLRMMMAGVGRIFMGAVKTLLIVPLMLPYATDYKALLPYMGPWAAVVCAALLYSCYIYIDFSGYCDTAIGMAYMMGIRTPENFNNPYLSTNISEFWKRWHITFSSFLKMYVFKPVIALLNRSSLRKYRMVVSVTAYMVTFFVCGLWHGSTLNFVLWGLWHGVGLSVYKICVSKWPQKTTSVHQVGGVLLTFAFVTIGWVFFNYPVDKLLVMFKMLFG